MAQTASLTPEDFIKKTIGNLLFTYYSYVDRFHIKPKDLEDLVDGLLYIMSAGFIQKKQIEDMKASMQKR